MNKSSVFSEPNSVQTWTPGTTLHPRNVQTPDPRNEINVTGEKTVQFSEEEIYINILYITHIYIY